ncbi:hypothetical protein B0H14DRAFT_2585148 [Mycena olivaceomarginata]|nr:hypothetical protein B0H14DRAFT_2585148 [Mycena olivaceomarginata]
MGQSGELKDANRGVWVRRRESTDGRRPSSYTRLDVQHWFRYRRNPISRILSHVFAPRESGERGHAQGEAERTTTSSSRSSNGWRNRRKILEGSVASNENQVQLQKLVELLQKPAGERICSSKTDLKSVIEDFTAMEADAMCKLIQLALNIDNLRKEAAGKGKHRPGDPALAAQYGKNASTFQNWHNWGTRLLYLCGADGVRLSSIWTALDALYEKCPSTHIPALDNLKFVWGKDTFSFTDVAAANRVLEAVETNLYKLPPRASDWKLDPTSPWTPNPYPAYNFAPVVAMKTNSSTAALQNEPKVSGSFTDAAKLRQQRQMGAIHEQTFDPSSRSWSKLAPRPEKRKHPAGARAKEDGPAKRPATSSAVSSGHTKPPVLHKFTVVLTEKPKTVYNGMYRMPDSGKMTSLHRCGHIRMIEFPSSATPADIAVIIADKYSTLPAIAEGRISMFGFALL